MNIIDKYIEELESMLEGSRLYFHPYTLKTVEIYFHGFNRSILISNDLIKFDDLIYAQRDAIIIRGWSSNSLERLEDMRKKRMSEEEIIKEFIKIQIEMWRILEKNNETKDND
jgi:hypothetical protein